MSSKKALLFRITLFCAIALSMLLLVLSLTDENARLPEENVLSPIALTGEYSVNGGPFYPLGDGAALDRPGHHTVTVRGRFDRQIERNQVLMLRIDNLRVSMLLNGEEAFCFGALGTYPAFVESPGSVWKSYASPGITPDDEIVFKIETVYPNDAAKPIGAFLSGMKAGTEWRLYTDALGHSRLSFISGAMILSLGCVLLLATVMGLCFHLPFMGSVALFSGIMICGGAWLLGGCDSLSLLLPYPAFNNLADQVNMYLLPVFSAMFTRSFIKSRLRVALDVDAWICAGFLLVGAALQLTGVMDLTRMQPVGNVPILLTVLVCILCLWHESKQPDGKNAYYTLLSVLPLSIGAALDVLNYYLRFAPRIDGTPIGFLFFAVMQMAILLNTMQEGARKSLQLENDLLQSRVAMMLSQIQPHFLYNSLTAIKQLCLEDPVRAEQAIGDFAGYLRTNLDSLGKTPTIPLVRELGHVERYIRLEQMRFGERVRIRYDLLYTGFAVPTLTVQPLVENAVRYGITKKAEGGTVTVFAEETDTDYVVRVSDDGVGFDPAEKPRDDRNHIGLENVKSRVAALCDGVVTVESRIGVGTDVTIKIPKKEADIT